MKRYPLTSPYVQQVSEKVPVFEEFILVCLLFQCPFHRFLTNASDGTFVLLKERRSPEESLPVCSALREEWDPSLAPEDCPIRKGQITPWNQKGENLLYRLLGGQDKGAPAHGGGQRSPR